MNRFDKYALYYLVGTSPVFIIFMIWASMVYPTATKQGNIRGGFWDIFAWFFIVWILDLFYVVIKMLFSRKLRNIVMAKMAGVKERDERESIVAGNAAKFSFLSTFAILLVMLLFSSATFSIKKYPKTTENKTGTAMVGFGFKFLDDAALTHEKVGDEESFNYKSLPLTKPVLIFLVMLWQIGSYHLVARRDLREE
jgi:uncharacterized membrane protein (DUF373 family)